VGRATLILGGIRSGKSAFAEKLAGERRGPTLYLATGQPVDSEMEERIRRHRENRPAAWRTLEAPLDLAGPLEIALAAEDALSVILVDSLDGWVSNLLLKHEGDPAPTLEDLALSHIQRLTELMGESQAEFFLVSSEVGFSLVSPHALGRRFQDLLGLVNQAVAAAADTVYLLAAGLPILLKGSVNGPVKGPVIEPEKGPDFS